MTQSGQFYGAPPSMGQPAFNSIPTAFDSTNYNQPPSYLAGTPGAMQFQPPGSTVGAAPGAVVNPQEILPGLEEMDLSIQCNQDFLRSTTGKLLLSQSMANSTKVPIGVICTPMAGDVGTENDLINVIDFGTTGIIRCKKCRTYINPYVGWLDNGRRWRCNICGILNDVPNAYFSNLDQSGQRKDRSDRPELSRCSVEFIAPSDYMVRPPVPPGQFLLSKIYHTH